MADLYAVAGAKIYIGTVAMARPDDDVDESDFSGVTWTEIADWTQCGAFGDTRSVITTQVISRKRDVKLGGTLNAGQMQNQFATNTGDAGQVALIAAAAGNSNWPFKIEWDDAPSGGTPTLNYFIGLVTSAQQAGGGANTVRQLNATIEINSNIVDVPAAA
ncbi:MAG: hypothetical protein BGN87_00145 [Rhizobiales bacterium 65-79]|nr:hypothetical protein [Hyphomicrobiales bacterium]OJU02596.1 MAG: hypothetical protein BGN87_00145 [Rhizobiales bacterium 65-79]